MLNDAKINLPFDTNPIPLRLNKIMKRAFIYLFVFFAGAVSTNAQSINGQWQGALVQDGKQDTFSYVLDITMHANGTVMGKSHSKRGVAEAYFSITGVLQEGKLLLQEVEQLSPKSPQWCLKYITLQVSETTLKGSWKADKCKPGSIALYRRALTTKQEKIVEKEKPFSLLGAWTGYLDQSDREYGFYFETNFEEEGRGTSFIVSEGNGGSATHELAWRLDGIDSTLRFQEQKVLSKTDTRWKWCIKKSNLTLTRKGDKYILQGPWSGYLEGHLQDDQASRCADGNIYLEKPVELFRTTQFLETTKPALDLATQSDRKIKLQRTIDVHNPTVKIRVWDNGTVDGDIATIFLNGSQILSNYRVTKTKRAIPVTLQEGVNVLVLHAVDLGEITPNTVAISVDDGVEEQTIILSSNLEESGALLVRQFKIK